MSALRVARCIFSSNKILKKFRYLKNDKIYYISFSSFCKKMNDIEENNLSSALEDISSNTDVFTIDTRPFTTVTEGHASVNFPSSLDVFYNPVQEFNRDFSIAVLRLFASDFQIVREAVSSKNKSDKPNGNAKTKLLKLREEDFKLIAQNTNLLPGGKREDGIRVLEALSASGLRSIRYAKEVGGVKEIVANDISKAAIDCIKINVSHNEVENIVTPSLNDARLFMYQRKSVNERFEVIDLDPYGSPHMFLDGAVQCIADGGLLMVTCTDMAVLCGKSPESCNLKYGALSMNHRACHEMGLRIILQCIESNANKYGRYIVPMISLSADFYCRVFVQVFTSQIKCKESFSKLSWIHKCTSCESTSFQQLGYVVKDGNSIKYQLGSPPVGPICQYCGGFNETAGPIWTAPIHDKAFVSRLRKTLEQGSPLGTQRRVEGTLSLIEEELPNIPLYFVLDKLFSVLRMSTCRRREFASALLNSGWKVSPTHCHKNGIKTDAPMEFIWEILRAKEKQHPVNTDILPLYHPARSILRGEKIERTTPKCFTNYEKTSADHNKTGNLLTKLQTDFSISTHSQLETFPNCTVDAATSGNYSSFSESSHANSAQIEKVENSIMRVDFSLHQDAESKSERNKLLRFPPNPAKNWGPKMRATTSLYIGDLQAKSKTNQGKRKRKHTKDQDSEELKKLRRTKNV